MTARDGPEIRIQKLPHFDGLSLPSYATAGAAGMDVEAAVEADMVLAPAGVQPFRPASPWPFRQGSRYRCGPVPASR